MTSRIFTCKELRGYITTIGDPEAKLELPAFARDIALSLRSLVSRTEFHPRSNHWGDYEGPVTSHGAPRPEHELESLIQSISNGLAIWRDSGLPIEGTELEALADDISVDWDNSACHAALGFIEAWPEMISLGPQNESRNLSPYLTSSDADIDDFESLQVTIGNVAAAIGILKLDRSIACWRSNQFEAAMINLAWAGQFLAAADRADGLDTTYFFDRAHRRNQAQDRAKKLHLTSAAAIGKKQVHDWWVSWRNKPEMYASTAQFARAMLDKFPDNLTSEAVIARWVRAWSKEL